MKLFIWNEPYKVSYGSSLLFAVADTLDEAKEQAAKGCCYQYGEFLQRWSAGSLAEKLGEPTRVLDLPCAEWHEWKE